MKQRRELEFSERLVWVCEYKSRWDREKESWAMSLRKFLFYFFVHALVKLESRVGDDVDCYYTKNELSVKLTGEKTVQFVVKWTCGSPIVWRDRENNNETPSASQNHNAMFGREWRMLGNVLHSHRCPTVQPTCQPLSLLHWFVGGGGCCCCFTKSHK